MLENETRKAILDLINREVVPAVGCTEPMSVALCTAKATEQAHTHQGVVKCKHPEKRNGSGDSRHWNDRVTYRCFTR